MLKLRFNNIGIIMTCGIYKLVFKGTDKIYIGLSINIQGRYRSHLHSLREGGSNHKLQKAFAMYGEPSIEVLYECEEHELSQYELAAIEVFDTINNGLNIREGGTTGSTNTKGEANHRASSTNDVYISVFKALCEEGTPAYKDISLKYGVSVQVVDHIASGVSHKKWLREMFPEEYAMLEAKLNTRQQVAIHVVHKDGREARASSLLELSEQLGIPKSSLSSLNTGSTKSVHGWALKIPKVFAPAVKPVYTLHNVSTDKVVVCTNKSAFCRDQGISNRSGFGKFLKDAKEGDEHVGWKLLLKQ